MATRRLPHPARAQRLRMDDALRARPDGHERRAMTLSRVRVLALAAVVLRIVSAAEGQGSQPAPAAAESTTQRLEWSLIRPTPVVTLQIRRVVGFVMLVPAGILFLLYLFRPRPYVLAGVFAWAAGSAMLLALAYDSGGPHGSDTIAVGRVGVGAWAIASLVFGAGLRFASVWFRGAPVIRRTMRCTGASGRWRLRRAFRLRAARCGGQVGAWRRGLPPSRARFGGQVGPVGALRAWAAASPP